MSLVQTTPGALSPVVAPTASTVPVATKPETAPANALTVANAANAANTTGSGSVRSLSGVRKAAIVLLVLGVERSGPLLRDLHRHEVAAIIHELARLGSVDARTAERVMTEFSGLAAGTKPLPIGNPELAKEFLEANLGKRQAREILSQLDDTAPSVPFQYLDALEPDVIAYHLAFEHPQTIALVLSNLSAEVSSAILERLDPDLVSDVGVRLATLEQVTSVSLAAVEAGLRERMSPVLENRFLEVTGGVDTLVEVLTRLDKGLQEKVIGALNAVDPELGMDVKSKLFVFDDMRILDDRQIQLVLRNVDANRLPLALKGTDAAVRDLFLNNLSSRARENLVDEMELLGSVRLADVEEAQSEILAVVATLEESGELVINRGGADFVS